MKLCVNGETTLAYFRIQKQESLMRCPEEFKSALFGT